MNSKNQSVHVGRAPLGLQEAFDQLLRWHQSRAPLGAGAGTGAGTGAGMGAGMGASPFTGSRKLFVLYAASSTEPARRVRYRRLTGNGARVVQ
jgi:hypothetical protein